MIHRAPWRALLAEFLGTALLVTAVVGSGVMASRLSPRDVGVQLLENSIATAFALGVLILIFGPVSGAHFNPVVSAADWFLGRRTRTGLTGRDLAGYAAAQTTGAIAGSILANLMFALPAVDFSGTDRAAGHLWLGEIAAAGLILLIFALALSGRAPAAPAAVGAYIGAAYWFTSSTSFANPAVTVGRAFTDTFAGIAPASVPGFVVAQVGGAVLAVGLLAMLYPAVGRVADDVVVAHETTTGYADQAAAASDAGRRAGTGRSEPTGRDDGHGALPRPPHTPFRGHRATAPALLATPPTIGHSSHSMTCNGSTAQGPRVPSNSPTPRAFLLPAVGEVAFPARRMPHQMAGPG